ncbi:PREDICTED: uncharacterized protein LOC104799664 [Tarenaya hassleriana]|uniref:uncharacterized protein LOC104799664 n=1 Tax=Tarenaya hassleriana TaxID=28532 RepID=UPI00053C5EDD|nr:PREDICTED: uncharacterized protein LOC104799664 [Tarenaya hassleriana]
MRLDPLHIGEARVKVEVQLGASLILPSIVKVEDDAGDIIEIEVSYAWLPPRCLTCLEFGHNQHHCPIKPLAQSKNPDNPSQDTAPAPQKVSSTPRARSSVFLGYPTGYKGYKLLDIETNKISDISPRNSETEIVHTEPPLNTVSEIPHTTGDTASQRPKRSTHPPSYL